MADMDFVEGVGESSSPPRSFGGFCAVHDVRNDVYTRLVQCGHEEAVSNPQFRENLDAHFNRLPPSYGLDVNMEKVEDVLLHQKLLFLAKDPDKCPVYHIRFLEHISTKSDGNDDHVFLDSILLSGSSNEAADRRLPLSHKRTRGNIIDFEPCSKLENLNLDVRKNSKATDKRPGNIAHVLIHEVIFSTIDKPKLLSQLSALLSDIGLNIREAHVFSTSDGYSLDVFVVDGWPVEETDGLYEAMEKAVARYEGSWSGSSRSHPTVKKTLDAQEKSADWEIDRRLLKIGERIASGSCGDLYHGFYLGQDVAVKILRSEDLNDDLEDEFNQEVAILRKVQHKNVVRFVGACTNSPHLCIVTEYMPGGSLYDYLHKNHCTLKFSQLLKFAIDVCEGMEYLHLNNIIHRDLKTANLLMDTQHVLSYDGLHTPDCLAITAAGIAVALSEVPNSKAVAGVRIGLVGDKFIVNPTTKEMEDSELDLVLAGTDNAILMIEGYCNFLPEEMLLQAVEIGQNAVTAICKEVDSLVRERGKPKMLDAIKLPPPQLYEHVEEIAGNELEKVLQIRNKIPRRKALSSLEEKVITILTEEGYVSLDATSGGLEPMPDLVEDEDEDDEVVVDGEVDEGDVHIKPTIRKPIPTLFSEVDVKLVFKEVTSKFLRRRIVEGGRRSDGRTPVEIRPINSKCGLLPRAHGSTLFTRGETQSLAVVTLGDRQMAQRVDNLVDVDELKRFYLQYSFPPSCVGEAGRIGAPSRREIGHGMLAERALEPSLPSEDDFPYTIRVESTITESNGSSSMASVCGGSLALQDAGVPIKCPIAGIAMGLVLDTKEFGGDGTPLILSDITGSEDASGDMDFKLAGNEMGITAFQMDIKVGGITIPIMREALLQAKEGRKHILAEMLNSSPPPSKRLSPYAPLIHVMKVQPEKINLIIGTGGKKVKSIIEETGVEAIDTRDDGIVKITAKDLTSLEKSKAIISNLTMVPTIGDIYRNCEIKTIAAYGVFVEIAPGREGLCHISELSSDWLAKAEDAFKVGDKIDVKLIEVNEKGQLRLSRRALLPDADQDSSSKENTGNPSRNKTATQKGTDKGTSKKAGKENMEQTNVQKGGAAPIGNSLEDAAKLQKKFIRKGVTAMKERPMSKEQTKSTSS